MALSCLCRRTLLGSPHDEQKRECLPGMFALIKFGWGKYRPDFGVIAAFLKHARGLSRCKRSSLFQPLSPSLPPLSLLLPPLSPSPPPLSLLLASLTLVLPQPTPLLPLHSLVPPTLAIASIPLVPASAATAVASAATTRTSGLQHPPFSDPGSPLDEQMTDLPRMFSLIT